VSLRNTKNLTLLTLALLALASCNGLATKNHKPLVFALNLSSGPVSLILSKDSNELAVFANLAPMESRPLTGIAAADGVVLRYGVGLQPVTSEWTDPSGTPYNLRFQVGSLYAVVVDTQGHAAVYTLPETFSTDPKVCVVNSSSETLAQVQAAPDWGKNVKIYVQDVVPVVPSEFYSIDPKTLGLYWQTGEQVSRGAHFTAKALDGKPLRASFLNDRYYLFLAGEGSLRDLTPTLE